MRRQKNSQKHKRKEAYLRKKKQEINLEEIYSIAEEDKELDKIIDKDSYNRIIAKLDKQEQEIVSLKILSHLSFKEIARLLEMPIGTVQWKYYTSMHTLQLLLGNISMVIIGLLLFVKNNMTSKKMQESNMSEDSNLESETESEKIEEAESEIASNVENKSNSSESANVMMQNEIIEVPEPQETNDRNTNSNIGILSFTGIFLFFSIVFTVIFVKHQQKAHKNVSK